MDTAYVKQTVGTALSEALTQLILHGHSQTHPKLSSNLETNPYSTKEDPVTFVARYLLNYSENADKCKKDDQDQEKIKKIIDRIHQKKKEADQKCNRRQSMRKILNLLPRTILNQKMRPIYQNSLQQMTLPGHKKAMLDGFNKIYLSILISNFVANFK
jgi:hypothetical protein